VSEDLRVNGIASAQPAATEQPVPARRGSATGAALVAVGILMSRVLGLVRQALIARYLGVGIAADAFWAAFKIANTLQNMLGEGGLSASFIPVYSSLLGRERHEDATRTAGAVLGLLALASAIIVAAGVVFAPLIVSLIAGGFTGEKRELTILLTRVFFPGAGLFVLSAWCLGVLNSHRKFLLSYAAPVAWNVAMIAALLWYGPRESLSRLAVHLAWASVVGAALQFVVQLPSVLHLLGRFRIAFSTRSAEVRQVLRNFGPASVSRGAVQIGSMIEQVIASWLPTGAVTMIGMASTVYVLPVSLFGMSVSAAELPELARSAAPDADALAAMRNRVDVALRRIAYFVVPSAVGFMVLGDVIIAALLRSGRFGETSTLFTWAILAGSAPGLLATTLARLYSSTFFAFNDTRTPFRFALVRLAVTTSLGAGFALLGPELLGIDARWGAAGLTLASSVGGWLELLLLRHRLDQRLQGGTGIAGRHMAILWGSAILAAAVGYGLKLLVGDLHRWIVAAVVLGGFGLVYLGATSLADVTEARGLTRRLLRRR